MFIANTCNHSAAQSKAGCSASDIRWRSTDVFIKRPHILKAPTNLRAV
jgi:hypothetical protein